MYYMNKATIHAFSYTCALSLMTGENKYCVDYSGDSDANQYYDRQPASTFNNTRKYTESECKNKGSVHNTEPHPSIHSLT